MNTEQLTLIRNFFATKPVINAYLFGSQARGEANSNSDVDILVDLDYSQRIGLKFIKMRIELEEILQMKVDLVSSNGLSKHIKPIIEKEKQLIYVR